MLDQIMTLFRKPSAQVIAQQELDDARRDLLSYQAQKEYSEAMVDYLTIKVNRLKSYVQHPD